MQPLRTGPSVEWVLCALHWLEAGNRLLEERAHEGPRSANRPGRNVARVGRQNSRPSSIPRGNAPSLSQRDYILQPRVARNEPPWVPRNPNPHNSRRSCINPRHDDRQIASRFVSTPTATPPGARCVAYRRARCSPSPRDLSAASATSFSRFERFQQGA